MNDTNNKLFDQFLGGYDEPAMNAIWIEHQKKFMDFWRDRIMNEKSPALTENEIDAIIRILDTSARGNTKNDIVVARAMIPQNRWYKLFNNIRDNREHAQLIDQLLKATEDNSKVSLLDKLHKVNDGWKNHLTGPSANGINTLLAAANPFETLHIVSLKDRINLMEYLGYPNLAAFDALTWGGRIVESGRFIIEYFRKAGIDNNARTISSFVYSPSLREEWKPSSEPEQEEECNYWVFQGNPKRFDFAKEHAKGGVTDWSVSAHRQLIKPGDKVIIYQTGPKAGIYALAEITTDPYERNVSASDATWNGEDQFSYAVGIHITHDISQTPILRDKIDSAPELSELNGGNQGTNFKATSNEYKTVLKLIDEKIKKRIWLYAPGEGAKFWDEFSKNGIMGLGWDKIGDLRKYKNRDEIRSSLIGNFGGDGSKKNDVSTLDDFLKKINIGDIIIVKRGRGEILGYGIVTSDYSFEPSRLEYKHIRNVDWVKKGNWEVDFSLVLKTLTDITDYESTHPEYDMYYQYLLALMEKGIIPTKVTSSKLSLNTILYGPPGTGKTYHTINRAIEIIDSETYDDSERDALNKRFEELVVEGQICFTTFHQSMSYEDFIEGIKPENHPADGSLTYDVKDGLFKEFSEKARSNWSASKAGIPSQLTFEEAWSKFLEDWEDEPEMKIPTIQKHYTIIGIKPKSIAFKKANGSTSHTLSINTLRDYYYGTREMSEGGLKVYYPGLVEKLKSYQGTSVSSPLKNFVIIIDEINRGNVSQIFGELITLIESDKRLGMTEALKVTLPYSNEEFGVPPNLFIIGTMNTADRSVEALDAALRRRFSFTEMPPKYDLPELNRVVNGVLLSSLLKTINVRVEKLLDRDHTIGHSYFFGDSINLKDVFKNKIIPLLQEYFFGDYGKIGLVLGNGFVELENSVNPSTFFADFDYDEKIDLAERKVYRLKSFDKEEDFNNALQKLMGKS